MMFTSIMKIINMFYKQKLLKESRFIFIFTIYLLIDNIIILSHQQPIGYVIDIYALLPVKFYINLILSFFLSSILMFKNQKKMSLFILMTINIEVLIIPHMLGYFLMGRYDDMSYLGETTRIINTGFLSQSDVYPATFIIGSIFSLITNIQINTLQMFLSIFISFIFIIGMMVFFRKFIDNSDIYLIALLSTFIFYFSHFHFFSLTPHFFFFSMIPFYMFLFYMFLYEKFLKNKNMSISFMMVLILILIPFTHPFIFLFLSYIFLVIIILRKLFDLKISNPIKASILLNTAFLFWFISNITYLKDLKHTYNSYIRQITQPVFTETATKLAKIHLNFFEFVRLLNFYYGRYYIPTIFIIIAIIIVYKNKNMFNKSFIKNYSTLMIIYISLLTLELVFFFNKLIVHQPDRLTNLNFVVFAQIPLFAYSLYIIFLRKSRSNKNIFIVLFILTSVWTLSLFGILDSPITFTPNEALTYNEVEGMKWFYQTKWDYSVGTPASQTNRFRDLFAQDNIFVHTDKTKDIPDHFGYTKNNISSNKNFSEINLGKQEKIYLIIMTIDEFLYQKVPGYNVVGRYTKNDYKRFRNDKSVDKLYQSLNIEIYKSGKY